VFAAPHHQFLVRVLFACGALFQVTIKRLPDSLAGEGFESRSLLRPQCLFLDEEQATQVVADFLSFYPLTQVCAGLPTEVAER